MDPYSNNREFLSPFVKASDRLAREAPLLHRAIHGRRFLLPVGRQSDYASQDHLNLEMEFGLLALGLGFPGTYKDDIHHAVFANHCGALWHDRPILFLEKELGGPLLESALPNEMVVEDIQWPWPQFRVMLPLGLLTIERGGAPRSLTHLDIVRISTEGLGMPGRYAEEAESYFARRFPEAYRNPERIPLTKLTVNMGEPYMCVAGDLHWAEVGNGIGTSYASIMPWNNKRIEDLFATNNDLQSSIPCDEADNDLLDRMLRLTLNVLLFLSQKPFFYKPEIIRPLRTEGKHHIKPALARAHFVGAERFKRASELFAAHEAKAKAAGATGVHLPAHWRKGHWKRQPYGPKSTLRRWQWISIYHTFGPGGIGSDEM